MNNKFNFLCASCFLFIFILFFQLGCMHSGYGIDVNVLNSKILENDYFVESQNKYKKQLDELSLLIKENSFPDYSITATRGSCSIDSFSHSQYFENLSDYYNIKIVPHNKTHKAISKLPAEISFNVLTENSNANYYLAKKEENNNHWSLLKPNISTASNLTFYTFTFSDWLLVREKNKTLISPVPTITTNSIYANSENEKFTNDLEIKVCIPYSQINRANLKIFGRGIFPLKYDTTVLSATSSYNINLLSLAIPETNNGLATYSLVIKTTEYTPADLKKTDYFIIAQAEYTDDNNINYLSQKKIDFEIIPQNLDPDIVTIKSYYPSQNGQIAVNSPITLTFSESMATSETENAISFLPEISGEIKYEWSQDNRNLKILAPLSYFESYSMTINTEAVSTKGNHFQEPFVLLFETPANSQEQPQDKPELPLEEKPEPGNKPNEPDNPSLIPYVVSITPDNFSENIRLNEAIKIVFSKAMKPQTVEEALTITPFTDPTVYQYNWIDDKTLSVSSSMGWLPSTSYKINLSTTCVDLENKNLNSSQTIYFKTVHYPTVELVNPENLERNVSLNATIALKFSKEMNTTSVESAISVQPSDKLNFYWSDNNQTLTISNSNEWLENSNIRIAINNSAKDSDNLLLANPQSYIFKTLLIPAALTEKCEPANNAVSVSTDTVIRIEFNKDVDRDSVKSSFSVKESTSSHYAINGTINWNSNILTFTPSDSLNANTTYNVELTSNYYDTQHNKANSGYSWKFTTAKAGEGEIQKLLFNQQNDISTFTPRLNHTLTAFNDKLWIIGGKSSSGEPLNDIYASMDGENWQLIVENAPFQPRFGHSCTVYNNKLWICGGITINDETGVTYLNDIWNSTDGQHWQKIADNVETTNYETETRFSKRAYHNMITYNGKLWVMLGEGHEGTSLGDIWSSNDGIVWNDRSNIDLPRKNAVAIVFKDNSDNNYESIFVIGGYGKNSNNIDEPLDELIVFKDKGTNWTKKSVSLGFTARHSSSGVVFNNRIWLVGGKTTTGYNNEILASNDGVNWTSINITNVNFEKKANHQSATFKDQIIISGGENTDNIFNEVWSIK